MHYVSISPIIPDTLALYRSLTIPNRWVKEERTVEVAIRQATSCYQQQSNLYTQGPVMQAQTNELTTAL